MNNKTNLLMGDNWLLEDNHCNINLANILKLSYKVKMKTNSVEKKKGQKP